MRLRLEIKAGGDIESLAFSPDRNRVATAGRQHIVRVLDTQTGAEKVAVWFNRETRLVAFIPDGSLIAVLGGAQAVLVDAATGKVVKGLDGFAESSTEDMAFSSDGSMFAVVGELLVAFPGRGGAGANLVGGHRGIVAEAVRPHGFLRAN